MSAIVVAWQNRHFKQQVPLSKAAADAQEMPEERLMPGATLTLSACFLMSVLTVQPDKEWLDLTPNKLIPLIVNY